MNRRKLLSLTSALALSNCTIVRLKGVTTITVNVNLVNTYVQAIKNGVVLLMSFPAVVAAIPIEDQLIIREVVLDLAVATQAFDTQAKGNLVLSFNANTVPDFISSIELDAKTLGFDSATVGPAIVASKITQVASVYSAFQFVIGLLRELLVGTKSAVDPKDIQQALSILGVTQVE